MFAPAIGMQEKFFVRRMHVVGDNVKSRGPLYTGDSLKIELQL
jgi:hypothetical protein